MYGWWLDLRIIHKSLLQCYSVLSTIYTSFEKNEFEVLDVQIFYALLNFEPGVVPAAENYVELFKNSYFTDVPTLMGDLKTFFSFQIEHLTLKFAGLVQCYTVLC